MYTQPIAPATDRPSPYAAALAAKAAAGRQLVRTDYYTPEYVAAASAYADACSKVAEHAPQDELHDQMNATARARQRYEDNPTAETRADAERHYTAYEDALVTHAARHYHTAIGNGLDHDQAIEAVLDYVSEDEAIDTYTRISAYITAAQTYTALREAGQPHDAAIYAAIERYHAMPDDTDPPADD